MNAQQSSPEIRDAAPSGGAETPISEQGPEDRDQQPVERLRESRSALQWRATAGVDAQIEVRVKRILSGALEITPDRWIADPVAMAREIVAVELPLEQRAVHAERLRALNAARRAYRTGDFVDARRWGSALVRSIQEHPGVAGSSARAWDARVLEARIAWASGDLPKAESWLSEALRLDPRATLSTRRVPPELAARYRGLQSQLLAGQSQWREIKIVVPGDDRLMSWNVEIDGVPGRRPVPSGEHFVVVRRPGYEPISALVSTEGSWTVPQKNPVLGQGVPNSDEAAERVCTSLGLSTLVFAEFRQRGADPAYGRIGLQVFHCGVGYGPRWIGTMTEFVVAAPRIASRPAPRGTRPTEGESLSDPWPELATFVESGRLDVTGELDRDPEPREARSTKPWFRRVWLWAVVGGVVAGSVTAAAVVGSGKRESGVRVDAGQFTAP